MWVADRTARKRVGPRQAGSEVESKRQKCDVSSSTETSGRDTSTTTTTSTSNKLTSITTPTTSDTSSPQGNVSTDAAHGDNTAADDAPPADSAADQDQGPAAAGPPPAGAYYYVVCFFGSFMFLRINWLFLLCHCYLSVLWAWPLILLVSVSAVSLLPFSALSLAFDIVS